MSFDASSTAPTTPTCGSTSARTHDESVPAYDDVEAELLGSTWGDEIERYVAMMDEGREHPRRCCCPECACDERYDGRRCGDRWDSTTT